MSLTLAEANRAIDAALAKARELEIKVSVSVCDTTGRLVAHQRMDGAFAEAPWASIGKAIGAATAGQSDEAGLDLHGRQFHTNIVIGEGAPVIMGPGGLPLMRSGELEGAIGVTGAPAYEQNEECAKAGLKAFAQSPVASSTR
jgi:glc operon protein GlcG